VTPASRPPRDIMETRSAFDPHQLTVVTHAVGLAEELVSNHYKMTSSQC